MDKKILVFVTILTLQTIVLAETTKVESSPPTQVVVPTATPQETKSFRDKILDFLGLGHKAQKQETSSTDQPTEKKIEENKTELLAPIAPSDPVVPVEAIKKQAEDADLHLPSGFEPEVDSSLHLPSGFEPEVDSSAAAQVPAPSTNTNSENISNITALETAKPEPTNPENKPTQPKEEPAITLALPVDTPSSKEVPETSEPIKPEEEAPADKMIPIIEQTTKQKPEENAPVSIPNEEEEHKLPSDTASKVAQYRKNLQNRLDNHKPLPKISEENLAPTEVVPKKEPEEVLDPKQLKFVNDEAQVLILANDDVVLGEVTKEAQLDLIDFSSYARMFWKNYNDIKNEPARIAIDDFIKAYGNQKQIYSQKEIRDAFSQAMSSIDNGNVYEFIKLVNAYPIIQLIDQNGNNLLHKSVTKGDYPIVKFLLMKGINTYLRNNENMTAMDIAISQNNIEMMALLNSAR